MRNSPTDGGAQLARRLRLGRTLTASVALATALSTAGIATAGVASAVNPPPNFGANVMIFDPSMPTSQIQTAVDAISAQQLTNQFGSQRYSLLFKPGTYGTATVPLVFQVGYYTEVAGLGKNPTDVTINGKIQVKNQCDPTGCFALSNFWRSMSNLTINVANVGDGCQDTANFWAVSQAAPMRRVNIVGKNLSLMDYCTAGPFFASGGFIADSNVADTVVNGSQQQWLTRNSSVGGWSNGVWNQVFAGVTGAPATNFPPPSSDNNPYTTLATNPISREKPYLYIDADGNYQVFVPSTQTNSTGPTWSAGSDTPGTSLPISKFFIATPSNSAHQINDALDRGRNILFTPGVYSVDQTIRVERSNTVILGMGMASITPLHGVVPLEVQNAKGVDISGLILDAGPTNSPVLLRVGEKNEDSRKSDPASPIALQDVFFRIGGAHVGKASESLEVNSSNVILDDIWAWRADHGNAGTVGWTINTAATGVVINGRNVTATGLFVEHYQKYNVVWNGENGKTIFFQNELPYDAPDQASWQHDGILGWAAYKVANRVKIHEAWGVGSYIFTNVNPSLHATQSFEVPNTPGVKFHDLLTVELGAGTIDSIINGVGAPVTSAAVGTPSYLASYP
jgi:hypothetical protein